MGKAVGFNPLSANPTKWWNTRKQFVGKLPTNCLSVFDHFMGLALEGSNGKSILVKIDAPEKFDKNTSCWTKEIFGR